MHFVKLNIYARIYIKKRMCMQGYPVIKKYTAKHIQHKRKKKNAQTSICTEIKLAAVDAVAFRKQGDMYT